MSGTNGEPGVTSGKWPDWLPVAIVAAVGVLIVLLNATSKMMEAGYNGRALDPREPWVWEISSWIMVVGLTPLVGWITRRTPMMRGGWIRFAAAHVAGAMAFSALHIAGMIALRKLAYASAGSYYDFAGGDLWMSIIYEWRKDLLTYAINAVLYISYDWWRSSEALKAAAGPEKAPAPGDDRIEIRDGGRRFLVQPTEIAWIEAAGNYVEIHAGAARHLARGTLAAFETRLAGRGFVRVHRSRLVNRARVKALKPTGSGDFEITLDDGRTVAGSRRYRAGLDTAA